MNLSFYFEIHTERNYIFVPNSRQIVPYSRLSRVSNLDLVLVMTGSTMVLAIFKSITLFCSALQLCREKHLCLSQSVRKVLWSPIEIFFTVLPRVIKSRK